MKERLNDEAEDAIMYEDLLDCELVLEYLKKVYDTDHSTFSAFISETSKFISGKKTNVDQRFDLGNIIKNVFLKMELLKQESAKAQDTNLSNIQKIKKIIKYSEFEVKLEEGKLISEIYTFDGKEQDKKRVHEHELNACRETAIMESTSLENNKRDPKN